MLMRTIFCGFYCLLSCAAIGLWLLFALGLPQSISEAMASLLATAMVAVFHGLLIASFVMFGAERHLQPLEAKGTRQQKVARAAELAALLLSVEIAVTAVAVGAVVVLGLMLPGWLAHMGGWTVSALAVVWVVLLTGGVAVTVPKWAAWRAQALGSALDAG